MSPMRHEPIIGYESTSFFSNGVHHENRENNSGTGSGRPPLHYILDYIDSVWKAIPPVSIIALLDMFESRVVFTRKTCNGLEVIGLLQKFPDDFPLVSCCRCIQVSKPKTNITLHLTVYIRCILTAHTTLHHASTEAVLVLSKNGATFGSFAHF